MQNNYLIIPNSSEDLIKLKGSKILFPLKSFSVGFNKYFEIDEIVADKAYLYINRLLPSKELDDLKIILNTLPKNVVGIVFEDLGILEITKEVNIEKIFFSSHVLTSTKSINAYLNYVDSCVISPDLNLDEVNYILKNANKSLCLYGLGHLPLSYSRRTLNSNYSRNYNLENKNNLQIKNTEYEFITVENEFGTITYDSEIYSGLNEQYENNIKYFIINLFNIDVDDFFNNNLNVTKGFLDKTTFYKLKEKEND